MDEANLLGSRVLGQSPDSPVSAQGSSNTEISGSECERDSTSSHLALGGKSFGELRLHLTLILGLRCHSAERLVRFTTESFFHFLRLTF